MARYKLTIAYDGAAYVGWQVQKNGLAIQAVIQHALQTILRHAVDLTGSSRTDSGVHALGQTAHFDTPLRLESRRFLYSLNALLPPEIRIVHLESVEDTFHARYSALSKVYHYHLHLEAVMQPFVRPYRWHTAPLGLPAGRDTLEELRSLAQQCVGQHDFRSFCNRKERLDNSLRHLMRLDLVDEEGGVRLEFEADGFLYKMVRTLVGTLVSLVGKRGNQAKLAEIFRARDRRAAGAVAPPQGLFLMQVRYADPATSS